MANPPTDYYVDPSIAANTGGGTPGNPYGDLQHALNTITRNGTDGDRINIKAGTAEILSSSLSLTTYGTPAFSAPLIFQGYTSAQGDRGIGAIDCSANAAITNAGTGIYWYDIELFDGPASGVLLTLARYSAAIGCYIHDTSGDGIVTSDQNASVVGCRFEDIGDSTHDMLRLAHAATSASFNYFNHGGTRDCRRAISLAQDGQVATNNIVSIDGASVGIYTSNFSQTITSNTVLSSSGTGIGIDVSGINTPIDFEVYNNYVEGFSGTGGIGLNSTVSSHGGGIYGKNAFYNNTTNEVQNNEHFLDLGDNESLGSSGLEKTGSDTWANRFSYFAPKNVGNMQDGAFPDGRAKGAVQLAGGAGAGGLITHPGMAGGMRG